MLVVYIAVVTWQGPGPSAVIHLLLAGCAYDYVAGAPYIAIVCLLKLSLLCPHEAVLCVRYALMVECGLLPS